MLPVAEDAEAAEAAHLTVDEVLCKGLTGIAELRDRHGLVVELVLLDDGGFNGHAVVVPAGNIGRVIAAHRMGADDEVLERLIERVAHVDIAVGERRAVVQDERRLALVLFEHQAVDVDLVPVLQHARLALRQARAHREVRLRGDDGVLIVHKCLHLFLLTVRNKLLSVSGRHRTIQQVPSANNIRRRSKEQLCGVVPKNPLSHQETEDFSAVPLLFPRNGGAWGAITGADRLPLRRRMALPGKSSGVMPCSARLPCILRQLSERAGSTGPSPSSLDRYSISVRMYRDSYRFFGS